MRIHLDTIGCRLNEAELENWTRGFLAHGHQLTSDPEQADMVVLNTCAVTNEAVRKSRKLMHRVHRNNPRAKLVVSGCYASLEPGQTGDIPGVDLIIDNRDKDQLVEIASRELELDTMPQLATEPGANPLLTRGRQRAFIKVQDGCRYQCTFCIVTTARGEERSRPMGEIVEEINRYHQEGVQEAVLTGVHIGGYGNDLDSDLYQLLERVLSDTDIPACAWARWSPGTCRIGSGACSRTPASCLTSICPCRAVPTAYSNAWHGAARRMSLNAW